MEVHTKFVKHTFELVLLQSKTLCMDQEVSHTTQPKRLEATSELKSDIGFPKLGVPPH